MPQVSEIRRPRRLDDGSGASRIASSETPAQKILTARDVAEQDRRQNPSVISIFALILRYHIPLVDLPVHQGTAGGYGGNGDDTEFKEVLVLGAGTSCSVTKYATESHMEDVCPLGTLVALKRYHSARSELEENLGKAFHRLIWQELQIFCHPYLKRHENICRLLFVGWEDTSPLPVLGLEHATYGTLAHALQHLRSYASGLRKSHLTVDIVLGLEALHACGFAHADIKTSNILIQGHPSRSIVAKISDFTGAGHLSAFGQTSHTAFGTPAWQPPEVVFRDKKDWEVKWQAADVYSLGMVIAAIWARRGYIVEGETFLHAVMPYKLEPDARDLVAGVWKHQADDAPQSVANIAQQIASDGDTAPIPVRALLHHTLSSIPERRLDTKTLVARCLRPFIEQVRETTMPPELGDMGSDVYDDDESHGYGVVAAPGYQERTRAFKEMFFKTILETATKVLEKSPIPDYRDLDCPFQGDEEELLDTLHFIDKHRLVQLREANIPAYFGPMAEHIYQSYLGGCGTRVDELSGATWLWNAAATGSGLACRLFCALEQSFRQAATMDAPRRLWAAFAGVSGFQRSATYLEDVDPNLHALVTANYRRHYWGRGSLQIQRIGHYDLDRLRGAIRAHITSPNEPLPRRPSAPDVKETPLHFCAAVGNIDFVSFLVVEAGADVNATNLRNETPIFYATRAGHFEIARLLLDHEASVTHISTEGIGIIHALALMDDCHAATLATRYLAKGATIQGMASEESGDYVEVPSLGQGLPIMWAAAKMKHQLFQVLLQAHEDCRMSVEDVIDLLELLSESHLDEMLRRTLSSIDKVTASTYDTVNVPDVACASIQPGLAELSIKTGLVPSVPNGPVGAMPSWCNLTKLLQLASDTTPGALRLRYLHGSMFCAAKASTVKTLLGYGADPLRAYMPGVSGEGLSALRIAVFDRDHISLEIFLEHLERRGVDVLSILGNCEEFGGYNALARSIYVDARESFVFLLSKYPSLKRSVGAEGRTPLHAAATQAWTGYVEQLLDSGVERCARAGDGATPFIWAVMRSPNLEVADILADGVDMDAVLGPDPVSGFTAFAKVVCAITYWRMDIDINRLRYLVDKFGRPCFYSNVPRKCTLFRTLLLLRPAFGDRKQLDIIENVFAFVVKTFPDKIDFIDSTGMSALHYAARYGNIAALKILIENKASLNIVSTPPADGTGSALTGLTPLDLAVVVRRTGPGSRVREGSRDVKLWEQTMDDIIELLYKSGGKSGSAASLAARFWPAIRTGELRNVSVSDNLSLRDMADRTRDARWPRPLPGEGELSHDNREGCNQEDRETVEVIGHDGLSTRESAESFRFTQMLVGAIDASARIGNWAPRPPAPPQGFLDRVRVEWLRIEQERKSNLFPERDRFLPLARIPGETEPDW
ncbi:hypothetical protein OQA88_12694 [Cercophora sp. LCS_1]